MGSGASRGRSSRRSLQDVDHGGRACPARNPMKRSWARKEVAQGSDLDDTLALRRRFWLRRRCCGSRCDPQDRVGNNEIGSVTKVGAGKPEHHQNPGCGHKNVGAHIKLRAPFFGPKSARSECGPAMRDPHHLHPIETAWSHPPRRTQARTNIGRSPLLRPGPVLRRQRGRELHVSCVAPMCAQAWRRRAPTARRVASRGRCGARSPQKRPPWAQADAGIGGG